MPRKVPTDTPEKDAVLPPASEGGYSDQEANPVTDPIPEPTGRDNRYWQYRVTIDPGRATADNVVITVQEFDDRVLPEPKTYKPLTARQRKTAAQNSPLLDNRLQNGREILSIPAIAAGDASTVSATDATIQTDYDAEKKLRTDTNKRGHEIFIGGGTVIPANGYLVLKRGDQAMTGVRDSGAAKNDAKGVALPALTAAQRLYTTAVLDFPVPADDLENFFRNGATIQLVHKNFPEHTALVAAQGRQAIATSPKVETADEETVVKDGKALANKETGYTGVSDTTISAGDIVISEIMWTNGKDGTKNQWIELHNTTAVDIMIDAEEVLLAFGDTSSALIGGIVVDTVGNQPAGVYWPVTVGGGGDVIGNTATYTDVVSMYRGITAAGTVLDGEEQSSWFASVPPSDNVLLGTVGSPGAASPAAAGPAPPPTTTVETPAPTATPATAADIRITEIMVASDDGRLPQWIEIANVSTATVSISGWSLAVENDSADADVVGAGATIDIDLGDVEIGAGEVALVVSKEGRNSGVDLAGAARVKRDANAGNFDADRIIDVQSQVSPTNARYSLISEMGFMLSLMPPQTGAVRTYGDVVGNLDGGWELPMSEGDDRSSLIRREMDEAAMATMGTDAAGWVLASNTGLGGAYRATYYGDADDVGTPGYDAGGALPVELSAFNAGRDRVTGAVVITWSTQSELNNAGFFIKRSQQQKGKFVIVNPTMIAGAGTTAEKQSYTYTDATADPNIVYYYQIEDVSLDGNRQTLTRAHRLKGHIGAAGKATTTWGELKSSRE